MPKSHLVALVIRLVLGFILVALVAYLLFRKTKPTVTTQASPSISTTQSVVIVTPSPTPSLPQLPVVSDNSSDNYERAQTYTSSQVKPSQGQTIKKTTTISTSGQTETSMNGDTVTSKATSADGQSQAQSSASGPNGKTSAEAESSNGTSWASASASSN